MNKVKNLSKNLKKFFLNPRFLVSFFILLIFTVINSTYVHADIDEATLDFYDANGIFYYDGKANNCVSSSPLDLSGNKLYNGDPVLTEGQLALIEKNKPVYEQSAAKYNLPWQMFAVIHNMESSLNGTRNPSNHQGIYQFYEARNTNRYPPGPVTLEEFQKQTDELGQQIISNYGKGLDLTTDDGVKAMWFKYNGRAKIYVNQGRDLGFNDTQASQLGEGSPYVMNLADANRDSRNNKNWVECKKDGCKVYGPASIRAGTFIQYKALGGGGSYTSSGISCGGTASAETGNLIADTAISFSWPEGQEAEAVKLNMVDKYEEALKIAGTGGHVYHGASCDVFVTTVMRYTKLDPDFVCCGMSASKGRATGHYVEGNPSKYQPIPEFDGTNWNVLQNGDIVMNHQHIAIFFKTKDGVTKLAHASKGEITNRTPRITGTYNNGFKAYRFIGANTSTTNNTNTTTTPLNTNNSTNSTNNTVNTPTEQ